jgi:hypothetical protein
MGRTRNDVLEGPAKPVALRSQAPGTSLCVTRLYVLRALLLVILFCLVVSVTIPLSSATREQFASASYVTTAAKSHRSCVSTAFLEGHPKTIAFFESHQRLLKALSLDPAAAAAVAKDPSPANIAAAEKAFGLKGLTELAKYKTQLTQLVEPYLKQLTCLVKHPNNRIPAG